MLKTAFRSFVEKKKNDKIPKITVSECKIFTQRFKNNLDVKINA